jgi:hypothetical protein
MINRQTPAAKKTLAQPLTLRRREVGSRFTNYESLDFLTADRAIRWVFS